MGGRKKKYEAGKNTTIRFPRDFPDYALDFLNESDTTLPDLILRGIQVEMEQRTEGIFFPADMLTTEKKAKLEGNPDLQRAIMKWVDHLIFSKQPLGPINSDEQAAAQQEDSQPEIDEDLQKYAADLFDDFM